MSNLGQHNPQSDPVEALVATFESRGQIATALGEAARWGRVDLLERLLHTGLDVDVRNDFGDTSLILAASAGQMKTIKYLIDRGANVNLSQVNNGGFDQFFRNCETGVILHAPVALETISALACREIVKQAIGMIAPLPPTREARASALDALAEDRQALLNTRDEEFFAYPDDLTELLFDYVSKHPESFGQVPRAGIT